MKRVLLIITLLCAFNMITLAQIQVTQSGYVGIGTSSPTASLQISRSYYNFTFKPKNPGLEIGGYDGSANSTITFWHSNAGYNELLAKKYSKTSDSTLKTNIQPIKSSVEVLSKINGYSYFYSEDKTQKGEKEYGVLAQEIEKNLA